MYLYRYQQTTTTSSRYVSVATARPHHLPTGIAGEGKENDKDNTQDGEDNDPNHEIHSRVGSTGVVGLGRDVGGDVHQIA